MKLCLENIYFQYSEGQPIFKNLTLTLPRPGVIVFTGPSGCGKTTLLRLIAGLEQPGGGRILGLEGVKTGMVFQEHRLLPWHTALENASICADPQGPEPAKLLEEFGLAEALTQLPGSLSGGMRQRVSIARALCYHPDLLLLDEPFTGLDDRIKEVVAKQCFNCCPWIIAVTHDLEEAKLLNAKVIRLP